MALADSWLLLGGFALGALMPGLWFPRWFQNIDIRHHGSGNPGATNVLRTCGWPMALIVLAIDVSKGYAAVSLPLLMAAAAPEQWALGTGLAAVLGHVYSPWCRFRGGKGVATSAGVLLALMPLPLLGSAVLFVVVAAFSGYVSLASLSATLALPFGYWFSELLAKREPRLELLVLSLFFAAVIVLAHRRNIARLWDGTEPHHPWRRS